MLQGSYLKHLAQFSSNKAIHRKHALRHKQVDPSVGPWIVSRVIFNGFAKIIARVPLPSATSLCFMEYVVRRQHVSAIFSWCQMWSLEPNSTSLKQLFLPGPLRFILLAFSCSWYINAPLRNISGRTAIYADHFTIWSTEEKRFQLTTNQMECRSIAWNLVNDDKCLSISSKRAAADRFNVPMLCGSQT